MGLKDKMLNKSKEITNKRKEFTPLDLNEGNVQALFNRCLVNENSNSFIRNNYFSYTNAEIKVKMEL